MGIVNALNRIVEALKSIFVNRDSAHDEIHEGWSFNTCVLDTSLGNNDTMVIAFKTPDTQKKINLVVAFAAVLGIHIDLIEAPTWDNQSGNLLPVFNRNRSSLNTTNILEDQGQAGFVAGNAIENPTTLAGGTIVRVLYSFGLTGRGAPAARGTEEWILNPDTQYAIRLTSHNAANGAFLEADWYEHTD